MTISTTTSRASYNGNGVTTVFSVPFRFFANGDLVVQLVTISTGASMTLTLTTHYTVTGADDEDGGSLTMLTAPAVGERLVIRRVIAATQEVDYVAGDSFPAETHERALDRLTMLSQQTGEVQDRSLTVPVADAAFDTELPPISASKYLRVNAAGDKFELVSAVDPGTLVVSPFIETLLDDADAATAQTTLGATTTGAALFTAIDAAAARTQLGIDDSVYSFSTFGYATGVGGSYLAVTFDSTTINKGGAGMFTAPRAGVVRCRIGRFGYSVTSGTVSQVVLRFKQNTLNQNPEFYVNGTGVWSGAEAMFSCAAGDVFGVSVLANGGGVASVTLAGCSFEMMD